MTNNVCSFFVFHFSMEHSICQVYACVMLYDDSRKQWMPSGGTPGMSRVHIYQHQSNNSYRVVGRLMSDQSVSIYTLLDGDKQNMCEVLNLDSQNWNALFWTLFSNQQCEGYLFVVKCTLYYHFCYVNWFKLIVACTSDLNDHNKKAMAYQNLEQVHESWLQPVSIGY